MKNVPSMKSATPEDGTGRVVGVMRIPRPARKGEGMDERENIWTTPGVSPVAGRERDMIRAKRRGGDRGESSASICLRVRDEKPGPAISRRIDSRGETPGRKPHGFLRNRHHNMLNESKRGTKERRGKKVDHPPMCATKDRMRVDKRGKTRELTRRVHGPEGVPWSQNLRVCIRTMDNRTQQAPESGSQRQITLPGDSK